MRHLLKPLDLKAILEIRNFRFLVKENDLIYAPRDSQLRIGDVVEFNQVSEISNKDFLLRGNPLVSPDYYSVRGVVIEHSKSPPLTKVVRGRKVQKKKITGNFLAFTTLLIKEIKIRNI